MPNCLWCGARYEEAIRWTRLLAHGRSGFCARCLGKLEPLTGDLCEVCGRDLAALDPRFVKGNVCGDCTSWEADPLGGVLKMNRSLYVYNGLMRDIMARFKFKGDAVLIEGFLDGWRKLYRQHFKGLVPVPVPLSAERLATRFFNQSERLAELLGVPYADLLRRPRHGEKQSKKTRRERLARGDNPFVLAPGAERFRGQGFVIIDDVYTTGATVRFAAAALAPLRPARICSMTLAR